MLGNSIEEGESNFLLAASNVRDAEDTSPEVYHIQVANDQETVVLESAPYDRRAADSCALGSGLFEKAPFAVDPGN